MRILGSSFWATFWAIAVRAGMGREQRVTEGGKVQRRREEGLGVPESALSGTRFGHLLPAFGSRLELSAGRSRTWSHLTSISGLGGGGCGRRTARLVRLSN